MCARKDLCGILLLVFSLLLAGAGSARAQQGQAVARNVAQDKFVTAPGAPTCTHGAVQQGDPRTGPSLLFVKTDAGCTFPWHWHSTDEQIMMVRGVAVLEVKGQKAVSLSPGGYAFVPAHQAHHVRCAGPCEYFLQRSGPTDFHFVDTAGKEITPEEALKPLKEKPAPAPPK